MPIIINTDEIKVQRQGDGWREILLADGAAIGAPVLSARRWSLQPHAVGPEMIHGVNDEMLYVISGSGVVTTGDQRMPLEPESVLWLEPGDRYRLEAGAQGLEILQGIAPAE